MVSNPEFLREGSAIHDCHNPDRIVIGSASERATQVLLKLYEDFSCPVLVTDRRSSELIKYAANTFLATKISFINEMAEICERTGGNINHVAAGIGYDHRIGTHYLKAGLGFGGPCLTKDLKAFIKTAEQHGGRPELLKSVLARNDHQINMAVAKLEEMVGCLRGKTIALWGLAFKAGTDDLRDAPALAIIKRLKGLGATIKVYDPVVKQMDYPWEGWVQHHDDVYDAAYQADAVVLVTDWPEFRQIDLSRVRHLLQQPNLLDGRNLLAYEQVSKCGLNYCGIGIAVEKNSLQLQAKIS